jgi:hypothetical protein
MANACANKSRFENRMFVMSACKAQLRISKPACKLVAESRPSHNAPFSLNGCVESVPHTAVEESSTKISDSPPRPSPRSSSRGLQFAYIKQLQAWISCQACITLIDWSAHQQSRKRFCHCCLQQASLQSLVASLAYLRALLLACQSR